MLLTLQMLESTRSRPGPNDSLDQRLRDPDTNEVLGDVEGSISSINTTRLNEAGVQVKAAIYGLLLNKRVIVSFMGGDPDELLIHDVVHGGGLFRSDSG
jgi:hypothetical protein